LDEHLGHEHLPDEQGVAPGTRLDLSTIDPGDTSAYPGGKKQAQAELADLRERLAELQHLMWADGRHRVLVVFQAMDTGGKDGTIRAVFAGVNPHGVRIADFKAPTDEELSHDYLWRVHARTPDDGRIQIFNRSHYEDVLVVRVLGLVPEERWRRRYHHIVEFERMLAEEGTTIVKFFLHISHDEQADRLRERLEDPTKRWKFNKDDLDSRRHWDDYMAAYEDAISATTTDTAPWHVVRANKNWYRNLVVARTITTTLEGLDLRFPDPEEGLDDIVIE
jgi:PPK2 family polyphosphate:nucleotide phosphotransferase